MSKTRLFSLAHCATTIAIGLLLCSDAVRADWYVSGAQYSCITAAGTFELIPYERSSGHPNFPFKDGHTTLPDGTSNLKCRFGKRTLQAQVVVVPPQARGMCMGGGAVDVTSLVVDGVELATTRMPFNWSCTSDDVSLVKVVVSAKGAMVELAQCTAKTFDNTVATQTCETNSFDVDAIAAANAKTDHDLADAETQARESATRLPSVNDLAYVFSNASKPSDTPLCAHWNAVYLNAIAAPKKQTFARIAGKQGERVYIRRAHPELCENTDDDGCAKRAYVLPGDRVDVGFICGAWTHVQYRDRIRTKPPTRGWVETARIYGVTPAVADNSSEPMKPPPVPQTGDDPLLQAVVARNLEQIKRLIAGGVDPNGTENSGAPLATAIQIGDLSLVSALIRLGAAVNPAPTNAMFKCRILNVGLDSQAILDLLVKAGLDVNCRGGQSGSTQLMETARYNRLWAWDRIHTPRPGTFERLLDPVLLAKRLLLSGADPNSRDDVGRTALFYAMEANNLDLVELLLDSGANPNAVIESKDTSYAQQLGSTPLMTAFGWYSLTYDPSVFKLLLGRGADPNYRNESTYNREWDATTRVATFAGQTALSRSAADGYFTLARLLLAGGADPTIPREDGALPEDIAKENEHPKIAALIRDHIKKRK